jgi:hypothetical protein
VMYVFQMKEVANAGQPKDGYKNYYSRNAQNICVMLY